MLTIRGMHFTIGVGNISKGLRHKGKVGCFTKWLKARCFE
jgi:hypothetical protein